MESPNLWLMSNLGPKQSGVEGAVVWVSAGEFACDHAARGRRLLVVLGESLAPELLTDAVEIPLTGGPEATGDLPEWVARQVVAFVVRNRDVLLRHWNCELSSDEMLDLLVRV